MGPSRSSSTPARDRAPQRARQGDGVSPARVALVLPTLGGGGAERIMITLAKELTGRSLAVDLVVFTSEGPFRSLVRPPVRLVDLGTQRARSSLPALVRYLRRERPVGLVASQTHTNALAVAARRLAGVPTRLVLREENTYSQDSGTGRGLGGRLSDAAVRWAYRRGDRVVAVSEGAASDLRASVGLPADRVEAIANPLAAAEIAQRAEEPLEHPWFAPGEPPVVLGVGRLHRQKDFPTLLRAFARVVAKREARLVLLGEGPDREALARLADELGLSERVAMPGFVDNPFAYMRRAGVFVLSSRWEGLPGVLIEAMACGCPVVSTDCPSGPQEVLEGGRYGPLVPVGDEAALADAILATLEHPPAREALAASVERYSAARIADRYVELLLGRAPPDAAGPS